MTDHDDQTIITRADVRNLFGPPPTRELPEDETDDAALRAFTKNLFAPNDRDA